MNPKQKKIAIGVVVILIIIVIIGIIITQYKPPQDDTSGDTTDTTGDTTDTTGDDTDTTGDDTGGSSTSRGDKKQFTPQCGPTKGACPVGYCNDNFQCVNTFQNNEKLWKYNSSKDGTAFFKRVLNIDGVTTPQDGFIFRLTNAGTGEEPIYEIYDKLGSNDERKCMGLGHKNSVIMKTCDGNDKTQDWGLLYPRGVTSMADHGAIHDASGRVKPVDGVNRCLPNSKKDGKFNRSRLTRCDYGWSTYPEINN